MVRLTGVAARLTVAVAAPHMAAAVLRTVVVAALRMAVAALLSAAVAALRMAAVALLPAAVAEPHGGGGAPGGGGSGGHRGMGGHTGGPRYTPQGYPHELNVGRQYRFHGQWNQPQGYHYQRWGYGDHLPFGWFAASFWISDFIDYDLSPPPYGYAWVREGPDAVLVNVNDGTVVEVAYGVFY